MPRVLMLISSFMPTIGGAEKQALLLASQLRQLGVCCTVLTRWKPGTPNREAVNGINIFRVGVYRPGKIWSVWSAICWFSSALKLRNSYDVLHAHQPYSSALTAGIVGKIIKKPVICKLPGTEAIQVFAGWRGFLLKRLISSFIVTNKEDYYKTIVYISDDKVNLVPNGINIVVDSTLKHVSNLQKQPVILFVGRLEPVKAPGLLLEALPYIQQDFPMVHAVFVGDGSLRDTLERRTQEMKLEEVVSFVGMVTLDETENYYQSASVFVNSSRYEGISNAILEAMSMHVPVVASAISGNTDLVSNQGTGLLFEPGNVSALADAVICALKNPDLAYQWASNAYSYVFKNYHIHFVAQKYLEIYRKLLQSKDGY